MTKYADPQVCPGCRSAIAFGAPTCPQCNLHLTGTTAQLLFVTLSRADELVAQLRLPEYAAPAPAQAPYPAPRPISPPPPARRPALSAASVPRILLGLGALCLLVAALVFLAVAWSALGVGGRTAVLVLLTVAASGLATWLARIGLRAGAESFTAVALGLLTLDLVGADSSGWFGDLTTAEFVIVLGACLCLAGAATAVAALASTTVERLATGELGAALGLQVAVVGVLSAGWLDASAGYVGAILLSVLVAAASWRHRLVLLSVATGVAGGLWWLVLVTDGIADALVEPTFARLWVHAVVWSLIVAAVLVAIPAAVDRLPRPLRVSALAVGLSVLALAVGLTAAGNSLTTLSMTALGILAVSTSAAWFAPGVWGWSPIGALVGSAVPVLLTWGALSTDAISRIAADPWSVTADSTLTGPAPQAAPLLVVPCVLVLTVATLTALRLSSRISVTSALVSTSTGPAVALVAVSLATTLSLYPSPRWTGVAVVLVGAVSAWLLAGSRISGRLVAVLLSALSLALALPSSTLTLAALAVTTAIAVADDVRHRGERWQVAAAATIVLLGGTLWTGAHVLAVGEQWAALAVIATVLALAAWRPVAAYELPAAAVVATAIGFGSPEATWLALHLTLAGALVSISSLLHRRRDLGWIGSGLLLSATWVRLADLGVTTVEAYTMPLAWALIGVGLYRMRRDAAGSLTSLSPGLALLIVPSLLVALVEPVSPRALLVGMGCTALIAAGASLRWSAPLLVGAGAGLLLVLREAAYAQLLQQWVVIGLVGAVLTVAGVTWESRVRELRLATGYLRRLR